MLSEKALTLVRPGGWLLSHDYTRAPEHSECAGVTKAVNEFFRHHGNYLHIAKTRFAIHRVAATVYERLDPASGGATSSARVTKWAIVPS
jgi:hypothetical protein